MNVLHTTEGMAIFCDFFGLFSPKFGCHGNAPLTRVYRSVTDEFPDSTNPIISNHILVINRGNAFICIYSNLSPFATCVRE